MNLRTLRNLAIRRKLILVAMVPCLVALLIACLAIASYEMIVFRVSMVSELSSTADSTAYSSSAALAFADKAGATRVLGSLQPHQHIVVATLYDEEGNVFAEYRRAGLDRRFRPPAVNADGYQFTHTSLDLFRTVSFQKERLGTLYLQSDLDEMSARLNHYMVIVAIVVLLTSSIALLLATRLQTLISGPISHLADAVALVGKQGDFSTRAARQGDDELGQLTDGFNAMLQQIQLRDSRLKEARDHLETRVQERTAELHARTAELQARTEELQAQSAEVERVHKQLMTASRHAGMAEVAANVLHNVGNVLNSVNVSANLLTGHVKEFGVARLARVVALFKEHEHDIGAFIAYDPRGKGVPTLLSSLVKNFELKEDTILTELQSLRRNIDHINEIVSTQQSYAERAGVKEVVKVTELVEDSLRMNASALARHGVEVTRDYQAEPLVNLDKHKVLQILVNLVRNAKYACDESKEPDRRVTVRVAEADGRATISVIDNGVGIPAENLTRIFNHGFTTRAEGHGFGLHSGALAAQELRGSLTVHSDGPGQGAAFTLELPVHSGELARSDSTSPDRSRPEVAHA